MISTNGTNGDFRLVVHISGILLLAFKYKWAWYSVNSLKTMIWGIEDPT